MEIFDSIAEEYDKWYTTKAGRFVDMVETRLALEMFAPEPGMTVLDAGCGTGNFSIKLAKLGCRVTGVDISELMLKKAKLKAGNDGFDIEFHRMDIYQLRFSEGSFDGIISMAAFEFIERPSDAFAELWRVLKPGGRLLIGTINPESSWGELYLSDEFQKNSVFAHARFMTMQQLKELNTEHLVRSGQCLFIPPLTPDDKITLEEEKRLSAFNKGGFICAMWKKPE
jgi:ubiquinone/menaquinone biosynthesis C-methylase UbiE